MEFKTDCFTQETEVSVVKALTETLFIHNQQREFESLRQTVFGEVGVTKSA